MIGHSKQCGWHWVMGPDSVVMPHIKEREAEWDCKDINQRGVR